MASSVSKKKSNGESLSLKILKKLTLGNDASVNRAPIETGMFKHWWSSFKSNYGAFVLQNFMCLLFAVPFIVIVMWLMPTLEQKFIVDNAFNFIGDLGFGFTGATNDTITAIKGIYLFRIMFYSLIIPCFSIIGIGISGLFYSSRNVVWGAKIKFRHYLRGIKKYWWKFMLAFTAIGVVAYMVIVSIYGYLYLEICNMTSWYMWLVMIFACILALLLVYFMLTYLPTVTMYQFKHKEIIKNSVLLSLVMILPATIVAIIMALPVVLLSLTSFTRIILYMSAFLFGFAGFTVAIQCFGQYACDSYLTPLYEQAVMNAEKERRRIAQENRKNSNKNKKNKGKGRR